MVARAKLESDTLVGAAYARGADAWCGLDPIDGRAVGAAAVLEVPLDRAPRAAPAAI